MSERELRRVGRHEAVEIGREYIINEGSACEGRVVVTHSNRLFCVVRGVSSGAQWETMCYRLTDIPRDSDAEGAERGSSERSEESGTP